MDDLVMKMGVNKASLITKVIRNAVYTFTLFMLSTGFLFASSAIEDLSLKLDEQPSQQLTPSSSILDANTINQQLLNSTDKQALEALSNNNLFTARQYINQAIDDTDFSQTPRLLINRLIIRASIDQKVGANISALQDLQFAFRLAASTIQQDMLGDVAFTIASIHQQRNEHSIALSYAQQALNNYQAQEKSEHRAKCLLLIASSLLATQQSDLADGYLVQVKPLINESTDLSMKAKYFQLIGESELASNNALASISTFDTALKIVPNDNSTQLATLHLLLSRAYTQTDDMDLAIDHLIRAFDFLDNAKGAFYLNQALQLHRAYLLSQLNEFEAAYRVTQNVLKDRDLHQPISEIKRMLDMHANFQLELQQQENVLLKEDNKTKTEEIENKQMLNRLYFIVIALLLSISFLLLLMFLRGKKHRISLEKIAHTDELTKLYSRSRVLELLNLHQDLFSRNQQAFCVGIVDLDYFKKVNDNYGHLVGDKVLTRFGEICHTSFRKSDIVGRIGGEEFLIILPNTNLGVAQEVFVQLNKKLLNIGEQLDLSIATTSSIGLVSPYPDEETMNIVKRADKALYEAKEQGRNRVVIGNNITPLQSKRAEVN